jgi:hypothetical protein
LHSIAPSSGRAAFRPGVIAERVHNRGMQLQLGTALVLVAVLSSAVLVLDREDKISPLVSLAAGVIQTLLLLGVFEFLRRIWRIEFILPAAQFVAAYSVWTEASKKRSVTASTVLLVVTMIQLAFLLGRLR